MMVDASCYNNFIPEENISFSGGDLSSDTGALPLLDFLFSNELYAPYRSLPYSDHRSYTSAHTSNHSLFSQITSRFLLGYFNQSDQDVLKDDPLLHQYFPDAASQASISRFFSRISEDSVIAFQQLLMDQACCFIHHNCHDVILDADSAKTDTYGNQEEADWIYHYQQVGYHPFTVNEFSTKVLAASLLRPGKTFSAARADVILKEVLDRIVKYRQYNPTENNKQVSPVHLGMNLGKSNVSNRKGSAWLPAEKAKIHETSLEAEQVTGLFGIPKGFVNYSGSLSIHF